MTKQLQEPPLSELIGRVGTNLRRIRLKKELESSELAKMIGCHRATIIKYENGRVNIPIATLEKIADALDVTIVELVESSSDTEKTK